MLKPEDRFEVKEAEVAAKIMDGEAIIINLSNGMYYSLDGVGGFIWSLIQTHQASVAEIVTSVTEHYDVSASQTQTDVEKLVAELLEEKLVSAGTKSNNASEALPAAPAQKLAYDTPKLNTYRDMGDLLALDPPMPGLTNIPWEGAS